MNQIISIGEKLLSWIVIKPEIVISIAGWLATYFFLIKAQDKLQKNAIYHEVYKELLKELDEYASQLSEFSAKLQSFRFVEAFRHVGQEEKKFDEWLQETLNTGTNLKFHSFLQRWESYEIFIQDLNSIKDQLNKEHQTLMEGFQDLFLLQDPKHLIQQDKDKFKEDVDKIWEKSTNISCYIMDFKKVLQNYMYSKYGLNKLQPRIPNDNKYKVLTEKGLI